MKNEITSDNLFFKKTETIINFSFFFNLSILYKILYNQN